MNLPGHARTCAGLFFPGIGQRGFVNDRAAVWKTGDKLLMRNAPFKDFLEKNLCQIKVERRTLTPLI